ncbi:hypothetical protein [Marinimicrobium sp. ARAG 43.8]|uniref:hypothetical protein n=1 Tax=Marinimicrobium sp. ARAG 43.8 TaxID=3418719 RepID=UPI003CF0FEB3
MRRPGHRFNRWYKRDVVLLLYLPVTPLFFIGGPDWLSSPLVNALWNQGHWLFFAGVLFWWQARWPLSHPRQWLLATLVVLLVSAVIESIQSVVGRQAGWADVINNVIGTWLGLFWGQRAGAPGVRNRRIAQCIWVGRLLALALMLWQSASVWHTGLAQWQQYRQFPVIGNFEQASDAMFWRGRVERIRTPVDEGRYSLAVTVGGDKASRYSGVHLTYLMGDWRGYDTLRFSIFNPAEPLAITLRINDIEHDRTDHAYDDRFNERVQLVHGWNRIRVNLRDVQRAPQNRRMNMGQIRRLLLFTTEQKASQRLYLDNVRLEASMRAAQPSS